MKDIPVERLRQLVDYREDGELIHRPRALEDFKHPKSGAAWKSRWEGKPACQTIDGGYRKGTIGGQMVFLHRAIYAWHTGLWVPLVGHADTDTLNNRIGNLRNATGKNDQSNWMRVNQTGYKGVTLRETGKFKVELTTKGRKHYGGQYDTAEKAAKAYDKLARKYLGESAILNFPD